MLSLRSQLLVLIATILSLVLLIAQAAYANEIGPDLKTRGLAIADKLETIALNPLSSADKSNILSDENRDQKLRLLEIYIGFDGTGSVTYSDRIQEYKAFAFDNQLNDDFELALFLESVENLYNPYSRNTASDMSKALSYMDRYRSSENWRISYSASIISAVLEGYNRNFTKAISLASDSLNIIPNGNSLDANIAEFYIYSVDVFLYGALKNTNLFLVALDRLIESSYDIQYPVQSIELLNNLTYTMRGLDDAELTLKLVNTLVRVGERKNSKTPGLVEMRAAKELIRLGHFPRALQLASRGLEIASHDQIRMLLLISKIQSLAATGT